MVSFAVQPGDLMLRYLFLFCMVFVGCQKVSTPLKQSVRINLGSDPQTLDPRKARDANSVSLMHMLFEGLTRMSQSGGLEMALAKDVEISADGKQYLFHLRDSFWSNGDPVTSFDFAESWKTILNPKFATDIAYQLYVIRNAHLAKLGEVDLDLVGIQTPDAQTLVVELEQPIPYFLELVSMPSFFPVHKNLAKTEERWALSPKTYVCNGPFLPEIWNHSDQMTLSKNRFYWEAKRVVLEQIECFMLSADTEVRMFEEGKLDWAGSPLSTLPADAIQSLKKSEKLRVSPFSATYFYRVNTSEKFKEKKNPLSDPLFRKALAFCVDRARITDHILQGGQIAAKSLVPPEMGLSEQGYFQDDHREKARSLLVDALLKLDLTMEQLEPIQISYFANERNALIAQAVQKQWEDGLGIRVELEAIEPKVFFQRVSKKEFQLAAGSWTADFNDPINFLEVFKYKNCSTNNTGWEHGKYIDLLNGSAVCRNLEERKEILREAEQILMEQMPVIPIFHYALNYLQCERLQEVAISPLGQIDFRWAHVEHSPKKER